MEKGKDELVDTYDKLVWDCSDAACMPRKKLVCGMSGLCAQEFHGERPERVQRTVAVGCRLQFDVLFLHQRTRYC